MEFVLPTPPGVHGSRPDSNWNVPPLDGSLTVSEMYDFHYENNPDHPVFVYATPDGNGLTHVTFSEVVPAAHRAARFVADVAGIDLNSELRPRPLVAILASSDTITFFTTELGLLRAEIPFFPISPRNSVAAVAHLLAKTTPTHLLISGEIPIHELARNAIESLHEGAAPLIVSMPSFDDLYVKDAPFKPLPPRQRDFSATRTIVHSSGSTSFPKPVTWTDKYYLQASLCPWFGVHDFCGKVFGCHGIAMFHGIGLKHIDWVATTGLIMATFAPASPATVPTTDAVFNGFLATSPDYAFGPPSFFDEWARDPAKLPFFKGLKGIIYGGGPLNKATGDYLASEGVPIYTLYGATESGVMGKMFTESPGMDWEYMTMNPHCAIEFEPIGDGSFEMIILAKPFTELPIRNTTYQGYEAYATSDLLEPHPSLPGRWKLLGRKDDQIMLSTGEKTNPGPLEAILCRHPHVQSAVMFGRGRFQNGILIELKKDYAFDPKDTIQLNKFRDLIWLKVEEMNAVAPSHSRLFREMIIVADPNKPFAYNPKGAPKRPVILKEYDDEINDVYSGAEDSTELEPPQDWSMESSIQLIRTLVNGVLKHPASDEDDIFERGCDSLQATWIKQSIMHVIRLTQPSKVSAITANFVYERPTIRSLAQFCAVGASDVDEVSTSNVKAMEAMLARYGTPFAKHYPKYSSSSGSDGSKGLLGKLMYYVTSCSPSYSREHSFEKEVVFVTGTSGALGSAVLAKLVGSSSVGTVYAFNRPSKGGVGGVERQAEALQTRGYDPAIATSPKVVLIEGDLAESYWGIDPALKDKIRRTVTHIIHIAWRVDFNLALSSYENQIRGVRSLVDLALASPQPQPPRVVFTSSVGVLRNVSPRHRVLEVPLEDPSIAAGQGYGESKWVAEQILYNAAKTTPLRPVIVRVGQISGGINGAWHTTDWVPTIAKSSLELGCFPDLGGMCSWIPLDLAGRAVTDYRNADIPSRTVHLVHPRPVPTKDIFQLMSHRLGVPLKPYGQWLEALEESASRTATPDLKGAASPSDISLANALPALKIMDFFRAGLRSEEEGRDPIGIPILDSSEAYKASRCLQEEKFAATLGAEDVRLWFNYWTEVGFL